MTVFAFVILALLVLFWQAQLPVWNQHLQVDVWVWWERINYWLTHRSFTGMEGNEIFPATLLYIFTPLLLILPNQADYPKYLSAAILVNLVVIVGHIYLVKKYAGKNLGWFILSLLAIGPILLFRFDATATLLVILSLIVFQKKKYGWSGFLLGWAAAMKLYPIIILPYLLLILWKNSNFKAAALLGIYFLEAVIVSALTFFLLGGDYQQILTALSFHNLKYVSIESVPGSLLTLFNILTQSRPPQLLGGYGIWGITTPLIEKLGLGFFNSFWLLPVGIFYLVLLKSKAFLNKLNYGVIFCLILGFLIFSKNLHPQYIWWFMSLLPFLMVKKSGKGWYRAMWGLTLLIGIFNQLVYPLFYTQFYKDFYQFNQQYWVYYFLLFRNFLIIVLTWLSLKTVHEN